MMFHDDDAVPDIDSKSESAIRSEARELRRRLDGENRRGDGRPAFGLRRRPSMALTSNDPRRGN